MSPTTETQAGILDSSEDANPRQAASAGFVHLCNGLDPVRDGGMVPSILGMTGALVGSPAEPTREPDKSADPPEPTLFEP